MDAKRNAVRDDKVPSLTIPRQPVKQVADAKDASACVCVCRYLRILVLQQLAFDAQKNVGEIEPSSNVKYIYIYLSIYFIIQKIYVNNHM